MSIIHNSVRIVHPNAVAVLGNGVDTIQAWDSNNQEVAIDRDALNAEIVTQQSIIAANQYKQQRAAEYPSIGDQLDALFHAGVFPEAMAAQIQAIKDKYPKS